MIDRLSMIVAKRFGILALVAPLAFANQGCEKLKSGRLTRAKTQFLGLQVVFSNQAAQDDKDEDEAEPPPPPPATPPPFFPSPTPTPYGTPAPYVSPTPVPEVSTLPLKYVCSTDFTQRLGYNSKSAPELTAAFVAPDGSIECEYKGKLKAGVLNEKRLVFENLPSQCPTLASRGSTYTLWIGSTKVRPENSESMLALSGADHPPFPSLQNLATNVRVNRLAGGAMTLDWQMPSGDGTYNGWIGETPTILYDYGTEGRSVSPQDYADCDMSVSPLVIHIPKPGSPRRDGPRIELTAPTDGIYFDILGRNSFPAAFTKKLISWFTPHSVGETYFIALPNSRGEVNGVDQLFGNNTYGPDGKFAPNGYEALRKFDGRHANGGYESAIRDREITRHDPVFRELRLWADTNLDGRAQLSELRRLEEFGIESIDLNYDPGYLERDKYGNETRMRSVATASGRRMYLVFDLWFRLIR